MRERAPVEFSHGLRGVCVEELYGDLDVAGQGRSSILQTLDPATSGRYWSASPRWGASTPSAPSRSAMVRATRSTRS